jgi:hypothetical protein
MAVRDRVERGESLTEMILGKAAGCWLGAGLSLAAASADFNEPEIRLGQSLLPACQPFFAGNLPDFRRQAAGDVIAIFNGDDAHALFLGDAARACIINSLVYAQKGHFEDAKPEIGDAIAGFEHQSRRW